MTTWLYTNSSARIKVIITDLDTLEGVSGVYKLFNRGSEEVIIQKTVGNGITIDNEELSATIQLDATDFNGITGFHKHELRLSSGGSSSVVMREKVNVLPTKTSPPS